MCGSEDVPVIDQSPATLPQNLNRYTLSQSPLPCFMIDLAILAILAKKSRVRILSRFSVLTSNHEAGGRIV